MILEKNSINLAQKVKDGKVLSASEMELLESIASEGGGGEGDVIEPPKKAPKNAKNQSELARILEVSRRTIHRYAKHKDAPEPKPNGGLPVEEWRAFLEKHNVLTDDDDLDQTSLKARQILLQNRLLEQKIEENDGRVYPIEDIERETVQMIQNAKAVLLQIPAALAPQVVGVSIPEAEQILREKIHEALSKLCANPLGTKEASNAE